MKNLFYFSIISNEKAVSLSRARYFRKIFLIEIDKSAALILNLIIPPSDPEHSLVG